MRRLGSGLFVHNVSRLLKLCLDRRFGLFPSELCIDLAVLGLDAPRRLILRLLLVCERILRRVWLLLPVDVLKLLCLRSSRLLVWCRRGFLPSSLRLSLLRRILWSLLLACAWQPRSLVWFVCWTQRTGLLIFFREVCQMYFLRVAPSPQLSPGCSQFLFVQNP